MTAADEVCLFRIQLEEIRPPIWRAIEVPASYTFWELHVAVQDAMGWLDCHLHEFQLRGARADATTRVGMPDASEGDDPAIKRGWETNIVDYFTQESQTGRYLYDFGDDWAHTIELEATLPGVRDETYPRCVAGGLRACRGDIRRPSGAVADCVWLTSRAGCTADNRSTGGCGAKRLRATRLTPISPVAKTLSEIISACA